MPKPYYVIGHVSGIEDDNRPAFERARKRLEGASKAMCEIPHDLVPSDTPWPTAMLVSIHKLTSRSYPSMEPTYRLALLEGWEASEGARLEKAVAEACGIPCKTVDEWLEEAR
ncbi:DUF4406 domain-containing protein [Adlercreutzia caecimuris]|uniref:DUF4406 domain-containing protein n=1 Tax=Adlercreutzia caecimuris TaxID=671266 RepID=UPI0020CF0DED|nr:DUF4406 domain-containing protein [Adlercreutzia caecimuris]